MAWKPWTLALALALTGTATRLPACEEPARANAHLAGPTSACPCEVGGAQPADKPACGCGCCDCLRFLAESFLEYLLTSLPGAEQPRSPHQPAEAGTSTTGGCLPPDQER
jgi:hypothetical protein